MFFRVHIYNKSSAQETKFELKENNVVSVLLISNKLFL